MAAALTDTREMIIEDAHRLHQAGQISDDDLEDIIDDLSKERWPFWICALCVVGGGAGAWFLMYLGYLAFLQIAHWLTA